MDYETLKDFLGRRMSHVYQPAMIRTLLATGGQASLEDIARSLLNHDQSQSDYYEQVTKAMPGRMLRNPGIADALKDGQRILGHALVGVDLLSQAQAGAYSAVRDTYR